jgi:hypothetical protein
MAFDPDTGGYWEVASDGGIFAFGGAPFYGSTGDIALSQPIVGMAEDLDTGGYWLVASDGGIFAYNAPFRGSMGGRALTKPVVGMSFDLVSGGYWLVASDGGIFTFGGAPFLGSMGGKALTKPVLGMAASDPFYARATIGLGSTADGHGYWLGASDATVSHFGDAPDLSIPSAPNLPGSNFVAMTVTPDGAGYWLVDDAGSVLAFGDAGIAGTLFGSGISTNEAVGLVALSDGGYWIIDAEGAAFPFGQATTITSPGSLPAMGINVDDVVATVGTPDHRGYWMLEADGTVDAFGDAGNFGSWPDPAGPAGGAVGIAPTADGQGYWLVDGNVYPFGDAVNYGETETVP